MPSEAGLLLFSCFTILSLWLLSSCPGNDSCTSSHCVCILKRKDKEQIEHRESASQVCPQTEPHGHFFFFAWGNLGGEFWCWTHHHSKQKASVSEEEGEHNWWTDNYWSSNTSQREAASRQFSGSSHFIKLQGSVVTLAISPYATNPGVKPAWKLHIVRPQLSVVCCARYKELSKETGLHAIQLWKHGLEFGRPKFKSLICQVLLIWP